MDVYEQNNVVHALRLSRGEYAFVKGALRKGGSVSVELTQADITWRDNPEVRQARICGGARSQLDNWHSHYRGRETVVITGDEVGVVYAAIAAAAIKGSRAPDSLLNPEVKPWGASARIEIQHETPQIVVSNGTALLTA